MSLLILDDQLDRKLVQRSLQRWITCQVLHDLRPDLNEFRTRASRMGKVARVSADAIDYWQHGMDGIKQISWSPGRRKKA